MASSSASSSSSFSSSSSASWLKPWQWGSSGGHTEPAKAATDPPAPLSPPPSSIEPLQPSSAKPIEATTKPDDSLSASMNRLLPPLSPLIPVTSTALGFVSGILANAEKASLVFMAENAHRRPETVQGWYFYNKTKNYKVLLSGVQGGIKTGLRLGLWSSLFVVTDGIAMQWRLKAFPFDPAAPRDSRELLGHWTDGSIAGASVGGMVSTVYKLAPGRLMVLGTVAGGITGALQDLRDQLQDKVEAERAETAQ